MSRLSPSASADPPKRYIKVVTGAVNKNRTRMNSLESVGAPLLANTKINYASRAPFVSKTIKRITISSHLFKHYTDDTLKSLLWIHSASIIKVQQASIIVDANAHHFMTAMSYRRLERFKVVRPIPTLQAPKKTNRMC